VGEDSDAGTDSDVGTDADVGKDSPGEGRSPSLEHAATRTATTAQATTRLAHQIIHRI
jgi:hypothetical protein